MPAFRALLVLVLLAHGLAASAQTLLYRTVAEHRSGVGEDVGEYVDIAPVMGRWTLLFRKDGVEQRVRCKDIWGFTYKGVLFRISPDGDIPVRLMVKNTVCYYENGFAHLTMQRDDVEHAGYDFGCQSYLSRHLEGEVVPAIFKEGDTRSRSGRFRQAHAQFEPLFQCIGDRDVMDNTRQCVVDFEAALEGD